MPGLMVPWIILASVVLILLLIEIIGSVVIVFVLNRGPPTALSFVPTIFYLFGFAIKCYSLIVVWSYR